ncbi:unnamed protein product [Bursaphelenchus xylophilus]|uniref:(pine wood nematode) hypothetical protein n=1 Tax=Bursaphelenchus xylophilus TaxID=6326 RepID=A0A1I7SAH3_BURXY|nr:unnamed protein product [Bursaphelenchus xylophilus]CAG9083887.1 unnamed protein product [Bursaphelenchus xylophilus]
MGKGKKRKNKNNSNAVQKKLKFEQGTSNEVNQPNGGKHDLVVIDEVGNSDDEVYEDVKADPKLLEDSRDEGIQAAGSSTEKLDERGLESTDSGCSSDVNGLSETPSYKTQEENSRERGNNDVIELSEDDEDEDSVFVINDKHKYKHPEGPHPVLDPTIFDRIREYKAKFPKAFQHFEYQIDQHFIDNVQKDLTFWWKMEVRKNLLNVINQQFPGANLVVVGSTINGCGAMCSDMDLCCIIKDRFTNAASSERGFAIKCLRKMQKLFYRNRHAIKLDKLLVINAKVPILRITFLHPFEGLEVDLNVNNTAGINNSHLLHYYSRIDDRLPSLCLLIKHWAKKNGIGEAMSGTFNSYSLILLCIHFLQVAVQPPILPNLQECHAARFEYTEDVARLTVFDDLPPNYPDPRLNTSTVGELLIAFFDYYSKFDFENWAISIRRATVFPRAELADNNYRFKMYIEEPYDGLNTARCVTQPEKFELIMDAFKEARNAFLGKFRPNLRRIQVGKVFGGSD